MCRSVIESDFLRGPYPDGVQIANIERVLFHARQVIHRSEGPGFSTSTVNLQMWN